MLTSILNVLISMTHYVELDKIKFLYSLIIAVGKCLFQYSYTYPADYHIANKLVYENDELGGILFQMSHWTLPIYGGPFPPNTKQQTNRG